MADYLSTSFPRAQSLDDLPFPLALPAQCLVLHGNSFPAQPCGVLKELSCPSEPHVIDQEAAGDPMGQRTHGLEHMLAELEPQSSDRQSIPFYTA